MDFDRIHEPCFTASLSRDITFHIISPQSSNTVRPLEPAPSHFCPCSRYDGKCASNPNFQNNFQCDLFFCRQRISPDAVRALFLAKRESTGSQGSFHLRISQRLEVIFIDGKLQEK